MSIHEHGHYPVEPSVHDDYGPSGPEELALITPGTHAENLDQQTVSERGDLVPPEIPVEELAEQLAPDIDGAAAGSQSESVITDRDADFVPYAIDQVNERQAADDAFYASLDDRIDPATGEVHDDVPGPEGG